MSLRQHMYIRPEDVAPPEDDPDNIWVDSEPDITASPVMRSPPYYVPDGPVENGDEAMASPPAPPAPPPQARPTATKAPAATVRHHPVFGAVKVKGGHRTLSNGLVMTCQPNGGWPERHTFDHNLMGMDSDQRQAWLGRPQPTLLATAWRQKYDNTATLATTLQSLVGLLVTEPNVMVSAPFRPQGADTSADKKDGPFSLLISGLSYQAARYLLLVDTLATDGSVFFFKRLATQNSKYIGTLEGYAVRDGHQGIEQIRQLLVDCLNRTNAVSDHIRACLPNDPTDWPRRVFNSISITPLVIKERGASAHTVWNVFCAPPPLTHKDYIDWLTIVRALQPTDNDAGRGSFRLTRQFTCLGCKSMDHPSGLCPFPLIEGWLGPAATADLPEDLTVQTAIPTRNDAPRGGRNQGHRNQRGTGTRGHGRARGRGRA